MVGSRHRDASILVLRAQLWEQELPNVLGLELMIVIGDVETEQACGLDAIMD